MCSKQRILSLKMEVWQGKELQAHFLHVWSGKDLAETAGARVGGGRFSRGINGIVFTKFQ
jgi:hypothetical protein